MTKKNKPAQVMVKAPDDETFPPIKTLNRQEIYSLVGKFIRKAIPVKGAKLTIINGLTNRTSLPKTPYIILQVTKEHELSTPETYYITHHKIIRSRLQLTLNIQFIGNDTIPASEMGRAFAVRFNDAWAYEQFEKLSDIFFPLYSEDLTIEGPIVNAEDQYSDVCSIDCYFEYHPEIGVCTESAKEVIMNVISNNE